MEKVTVTVITKKIRDLDIFPKAKKKEDLFRCLRQAIIPNAVDINPDIEVEEETVNDKN